MFYLTGFSVIRWFHFVLIDCQCEVKPPAVKISSALLFILWLPCRGARRKGIMNRNVITFVLLTLIGCGGSSPDNNGGSEQELHSCSSDVECQAFTDTQFCEAGVCVNCVGTNCVPACDESTPCLDGFHCSSDNTCQPGCRANDDCCPEGAADCGLFECVDAANYCFQPDRVTDCAECPEGWDCTDTLQCNLRDVCNLTSDCAGGKICANKRCSPCTVDDQCPTTQTCQNGSCTDPSPPDNNVNKTCSDDSECNHVDGGYCSTDLDPRRCTKSCSSKGECSRDGFDDCNADGECVGN